MKVAILCPGPSLTLFDPESADYELVIGVNRAVEFCRCGCWVVLDELGYERARPEHHPARLLTRGGIYRALLRKHADRLDGIEFIDRTRITPPAIQRWKQFSTIAAIAYAVDCGGRQIDCYGMDWTGAQDWDGRELRPHGRSLVRWAAERACWEALRDYYGKTGITIKRVVSPPKVALSPPKAQKHKRGATDGSDGIDIS